MWVASFQGMPMSHATGAKSQPSTDLQTGRKPAGLAMRPAHEAVETARSSARNAISMAATFMARCKPSPVPWAIAPRRLPRLVSRHFGDFHIGAAGGRFGFGHQRFGDEQRAGRGHDDRAQQMFGFDAHGDVGGHDPAADVRHAGGHHGHQFRAGQFREEGRMVRGASVCPMKMLAATSRDSAPLTPIKRVISQAAPLMMTCMMPK